jgi:hypothetical protein
MAAAALGDGVPVKGPDRAATPTLFSDRPNPRQNGMSATRGIGNPGHEPVEVRLTDAVLPLDQPMSRVGQLDRRADAARTPLTRRDARSSGVCGVRAWGPRGRIEWRKPQRRREQRDPRTGAAPRAHRRAPRR